MPRKELIKIPTKCLTSKFTKQQQLLVVKLFLLQINLSCQKAKKVDVKIRGLGRIHSHLNTKSSKKKYQEKLNKKLWKEEKKQIEFSAKFLLY